MAYTKEQMNAYMLDRRKAKLEGLTVAQWRKKREEEQNGDSPAPTIPAPEKPLESSQVIVE